ncbi:hypothetical protein [Streptomyces atratus]|uniref:hypothetical protein n=1 Tax=Streptomyces atratus TaxID=1893 RepID=UPI00224DF56A|nr:hypothetical protein [Streptomyces atratus]MCX5342924.1 hypothetical protein [Streptomyces atratus]
MFVSVEDAADRWSRARDTHVLDGAIAQLGEGLVNLPGKPPAKEMISITMDVHTHVVHDTQREAISHMDRLLKRRLLGA